MDAKNKTQTHDKVKNKQKTKKKEKSGVKCLKNMKHLGQYGYKEAK